MSAPSKEAPKATHGDPLFELAEKIYVQLAARVYGNLAGGDVKKPDPKALAAELQTLAAELEELTKAVERSSPAHLEPGEYRTAVA